MKPKSLTSLSLLFLFLISGMVVPQVSAGEKITAPVPLYLLTSNFTYSMYVTPPCFQYPNRYLVEYAVINGTLWELKGPLYTGCRNVSGIEVRVAGIENESDEKLASFLRDYFHLGNNSPVKAIHVKVYTDTPYTIPVELRSENITISYSSYNSTHELVEVSISNTTLGLDFGDILNDTGASYPLPSRIVVKFLANKKSGEAYLIDGDKKTPVGFLPLVPFAKSPQDFWRRILDSTRSTIDSLKKNPWIIENLVQKVRLSNDTEAASTLVWNFVLNVTPQMFQDKSAYLGAPLYFSMRYGHPLEYGGLSRPLDPLKATTVHIEWFDRIPKNITTDSLKRYLSTGDGNALKPAIKEALVIYTPTPMEYGVGDMYALADVLFPPFQYQNDSELLTVPLPGEYRRMLNASYLVISAFDFAKGYFHVRYDPTFFSPEDLQLKEWNKTYSCVDYIENEVQNNLTNMIFSFAVNNKIKPEKLDEIYQIVKNGAEMCGGVNLSALQDNLTTTSSSPGNKTSPGTKTLNKRTDPPQKKDDASTGGICGPASLLALTALPLLLKKKKK
ncbi:hypothetical protein A3L09_01190 [Thermococcus profundus]|uniref:CGP-CTERM sorting domain-containing protein n=1 Tax=Thermococcus profundus TaxID=49899 RepID=A0A2Z2M9D4_THEPR|nr:CGP-CTERM sorting domain-containing protein [Thermococcus profundus]ASJ01973.1 hypothetical protein A3L09_01190 [Thermococcus profundus]